MSGQRWRATVSIDMGSRQRPRAWIFSAGLFLLLAAATVAVPSAAPSPGRTETALAPEAFRSCEVDYDIGTSTRRSDRVLLGLAAYACGDTRAAIELLAIEARPRAPFEDWRLFALADAATQTADLALAASSADLHLLNHPASILRHKTYALRTRIARLAGNGDRALSMARASRAGSFPESLRAELDVLAWEVASESQRSIDIEQEARQLLIAFPLEALELEVAEALRRPDGEIAWAQHFPTPELLERGDRLVEADLLEEALETLEAIAADERDLDWHLLLARALIKDRRGVEALALLEDVEARDAASTLDLAWLRAEAALDAATARRGRRNLPSAEREAMSNSARAELRSIVRRGGDSARAVDALKRLFEELADGEHFEEVLGVLTRLRTVDPGDTTGARYLWQLGWSEYSRRNYSGAIGYWRELIELYPASKLARSGRYWSARSHESLGNPSRAETLYERVVVAAATDYYRKHALVRLGREPLATSQPRPAAVESWPLDPVLARAEQLSDLGIDRLGLEELELLDRLAERRARYALRSRILARQGHRRESIQNLWQVFPVLGTQGQIVVPPEALEMYYPLDFVSIVERHAADNDLPIALLLAMIRQESAFDVNARSWAGARGLMQVMPATARELAQRMGLPYSRERLSDPSFSIQLGSRYFRQVLDMFDGELELALAGYNAGPYRIRKLVRNAGANLELDRFLEGLSIEESKTYVKRVVLFANSYRELYPDLS